MYMAMGSRLETSFLTDLLDFYVEKEDSFGGEEQSNEQLPYIVASSSGNLSLHHP